MMEGFKTQRKPVTYGKKATKRQLPTYHLFGHDSDDEHGACHSSTTFVRSAPLSPSSSGPESSSQKNPASVASSLFDLQSSDDEMAGDASASRPAVKRRRLTPVGRAKGQLRGTKQLGGRSNESLKSDLKVNKPERNSGVKKKTKVSSKQVKKESTSLKPVPRPRIAAGRQTAMVRAYDSIEIEAPTNIASLASSPTPPHTPARRNPFSNRDSSSPSAQLIEQLTHSIGLEMQVSKRPRRASTLSQQTDLKTVDSPSKLGLKSLRLTPEGVSPPEEERKPSPQSMGMLTPSRSRRRLIDALDSPRRRPQSQDTAEPSPSSTELSPPSRQQAAYQAKQPRDDEAPTGRSLKNSTASTIAAAVSATGSKVTYAKQRSHLSDIVLEDVGERVAPSIAHVAEPIVPVRSTATSSFGSQNAQGGDDDDGQAGAAIKSIHELRQAGTNARFQSILESMFEDIEAPGRSSKARRLRGLMSIAQKLAEPGCAQLFLEHGMHPRFVTYASEVQDPLSSFLVLCVSSGFFTANSAPLNAYQQLFDVMIQHSMPLLQETRELSQWLRAMSKDRKQNLSGATCQDIIDYQQTLLKSSMWTELKPQSLSPCLLALRSLEIMMSGLRTLNDLETSMPLPVVTELIEIVEDVLQGDNTMTPTEAQLKRLKLVMSTLEYAALSPSFMKGESQAIVQRLIVLRVLLGKASMLPAENCISMQKLALRLIISVTNNNGYLSERMGQGLMLEQIFAIAHTGLSELSNAADVELAVDESRLELLILALASLINFIECSPKSAGVFGSSSRGHANLEWLVTTFQLQADRAKEASSMKQAQALVPFGYLSMFLCTLCTAPDNRVAVRGFMKQKSLVQLLRAVEEFLMYFRTVEQVQVDEDASSNFTERFERILMSVRKGDLNDVATA